MPRKFFRRILPSRDYIARIPLITRLGSWLHHAPLWHLNRHSVAGAFAVGLFAAFMPVPSQMVLAAIFAILVNVNLPLSVALVWISNPITMPPLFYMAYRIGVEVLNMTEQPFAFELSLSWFQQQLGLILTPFLLGCLICGVSAGLCGYITVRLFWRYNVIYNWRKRQQQRALQRTSRPRL